MILAKKKSLWRYIRVCLVAVSLVAICLHLKHRFLAFYATPQGLFYDLSSDGKRVLFSQEGTLHVVDLATGKGHALKSAGMPASVTYPAFSPDGTCIAFSAESDLWLTTIGGNTVRLTHEDTYSEFAPRFSPDGQRIVFVRPKNNPFSPTGVFWIEYEVWTIQRDGTDLRQLTQGKYHNISGGQFTPEGDSIVFAAEVPTDDLGGSRQALFEVDAGGRRAPREIFGGKAGERGGCAVAVPALSPDGKTFVILSDYGRPFHYDLCLLNRDGSGFRPLGLEETGHSGSFDQPRFSPDGKHLFYLSPGALWEVDRDGKNAKRCIASGDKISLKSGTTGGGRSGA